MKAIVFVFCSVLIATSAATAQIELVSGSFFPAELEFQELQKITSEEAFEDPAGLSGIDDGRLVSDVGFVRYAKRVYSTGDSGSLSIEIVTLRDSRAAYSLLTLLRDAGIQDGPPGDAFTTTADGLRFAHGKHWVRIRARGTAEDLPGRVAASVSNRLGPPRLKPPSLVSRLPKDGYDPGSLRYYPGIAAFESYPGSVRGKHLRMDLEMEIAQARYSLNNQAGVLSLLYFPTSEMAEEQFDGLTGSESPERSGGKTYAKRAGPIVGVLEGSFDPGTADRILGSIQYSYSIRWVEDNRPKTIWGIPAGLLGTVVKSLLFVVLLCGISIVAGIAFAVFRVLLRTYAPKHSPDRPERTEITRLRLR